MNGRSKTLVLPELSHRIVGCFYDVYNELGHGFLESVYQRAMIVALTQAGLTSRSEVPISVRFRGVNVGEYRADLFVEEQVVLECKAASATARGHEAQLLHYLKASHCSLGIVLNFGPQATFKRVARTVA